jgi:hypothetical protein
MYNNTRPTKSETIQSKRTLPTSPSDGIPHHKEKKIWYLLEFKRTSGVRPDYLALEKRKEDMTSKQYKNFMDIVRKTKTLTAESRMTPKSKPLTAHPSLAKSHIPS